MDVSREPLHQLAGSTLAEKYRLVSLLGSGGMGVVYKAEQLGLGGRSVAVKLLRRDLIATRFDWFRAEAMAASRINHPHAVAIYDFGVTGDDIPFLVMEHLRGRTLTALIEERSLPLGRIVGIGAQVLAALAEAHACGVVHCDLTADNVIVERLREGDDFAKVIDFGLARLFDTTSRESRLIGTAEYMAPEQIRGDLIQPSTDLYAVGVLLYEMIAGRTPFAAGSVIATLEGHLHADPAPLLEISPDCPPALADLVARALDKAPEGRPASASEMRLDLLAALPGSDEEMSARTVARRLPRPPRAPMAQGTQDQPEPSARGSVPLPHRRTDRLTCEIPRQSAAASFVGRGAELDRLLAFSRADLPGGTLAVVGPPGIGKARLVLELGRRLAPHGKSFVAAADPTGLRRSWYPILSLLESMLGIEQPIDLASLRRAVARAGLADREVPGLAEMFGIVGPAATLELAVRRREAHAAAIRAVAIASRRHSPLVLCFADYDEYDNPSREVVRGLAASPPDGEPPRVIVTSRSAPAFAAHTIELGGLEPGPARQLAVALTGAPRAVPDEAAVMSLTGGMPTAIEQLAGWINRGDSPSTMPSLLVDMVSVRVNRLDVAARRILQAVAAHGTVASRPVVEACLPDELDALSDPVWTGLLTADAASFTIPSELVATVVWACTPADVRRRLHRRVLDGLGPGAGPGLLGHHAEQAGEIRDAFHHYLAAGADAERRFDDGGAARWYGRAVAMARDLEARGVPDAAIDLVEASIHLAEVLRQAGERRLAAGALAEAMTRHTSDRQRAAAERTRGLVALAAGDPAAAVCHLQAAAGAGLRAGERDVLCQIYLDLATALDRSARPDQAAAELEQAIDIITAGGGLASGDGPERLWRVGLALAELRAGAGRLVEARALAGQALAVARRHNSATGRGRASACIADLCERAGEPAAALHHRTRAIEEMRALGDRRTTAELLLASAQAAIERGPGPEWLADPAEALRDARRLAAEVGWGEGVERIEDVAKR
jgi:serine/threonine protein kinase/tetratricopeptide (TPR) repeat protein